VAAADEGPGDGDGRLPFDRPGEAMSKKHTYVIAIDASNEFSLDEDFTNK
jgi:hypothetical protein